MHTNRYGAALDEWKQDLIIARARRAGLSGDKLLEAQQELALRVAAFEHEADRANGASKATALTAVIDRQLKTLLRTWARYEQRQQRARRHYAPQGNDRSDLDQHLLVIDVRDAIRRLTPQEQQVCGLLSQGESVASIARSLQCGWHSASQIIERIREKFRRTGIDGWVNDR